MQLTENAYAKINLFLDVTGRRENGYHDIAGVMHTVSLCDCVTLMVEGAHRGEICSLAAASRGVGEITLTCTEPSLPTDRKNLAWRAAEAFFSATGFGAEKLSIHIEKNIPAAAGLAGGSTDAAAVLRGLNRLYGAPLSADQLTAVGVRIGADVPVCIVGGACITRGIGDDLTPIRALSHGTLVVACAGEGISTPSAYGKLDAMYGGFAEGVYAPHAEGLARMLGALAHGDVAGVAVEGFNLFESVILPGHSTAREIKATMQAGGARLALMSGSGPSVFGLFDSDEQAERVLDALRAKDIPAWLCHPINPEGQV